MLKLIYLDYYNYLKNMKKREKYYDIINRELILLLPLLLLLFILIYKNYYQYQYLHEKKT